jgi:peptide deformylase
MRGYVERPRKIRVDYLDRRGKPQTIEAEDFLATVIQHELDHLDGVLYIDRIEDRTKLAFLEEYRRFWLKEEEELPD